MTPAVLKTIEEAREWSEAARLAKRRLALVPTMGYLHEGHLTLMREARRHAQAVAVSIFVNPTQFGPKEDFAKYPRDFEGDLAKCKSAEVDVVFAPEASELYPKGFETCVEVTELQKGLCGDRRPGHFRGVATVVTQLFSILRPHVALFGEKDYQQLKVIEALSRDLHLGVQVIGCPTVREPDGLAKSSRNSYLSPPERARALALHRGLTLAQRLAQRGEAGGEAIKAAVRGELASADVREDYVELVDARSLVPLERVEPGVPAARLLVAGYVGTTRLIDNVAI
jgi:pantoate--beta-alanine ligase